VGTESQYWAPSVVGEVQFLQIVRQKQRVYVAMRNEYTHNKRFPEQQSFGWRHRRWQIMGRSQGVVIAAESILNNL